MYKLEMQKHSDDVTVLGKMNGKEGRSYSNSSYLKLLPFEQASAVARQPPRQAPATAGAVQADADARAARHLCAFRREEAGLLKARGNAGKLLLIPALSTISGCGCCYCRRRRFHGEWTSSLEEADRSPDLI